MSPNYHKMQKLKLSLVLALTTATLLFFSCTKEEEYNCVCITYTNALKIIKVKEETFKVNSGLACSGRTTGFTYCSIQ